MKKLYIVLFCLSYLGFASNIQGADVTLYTPMGNTVSAFTRSELTAIRIAEINASYIDEFGDAVLASATTTYNCHSYA